MDIYNSPQQAAFRDRDQGQIDMVKLGLEKANFPFESALDH